MSRETKTQRGKLASGARAASSTISAPIPRAKDSEKQQQQQRLKKIALENQAAIKIQSFMRMAKERMVLVMKKGAASRMRDLEEIIHRGDMEQKAATTISSAIRGKWGRYVYREKMKVMTSKKETIAAGKIQACARGKTQRGRMASVREARVKWDKEQADLKIEAELEKVRKEQEEIKEKMRLEQEAEDLELEITTRVRAETTEKLKKSFDLENTRRRHEHFASQEKFLMHGEDREAKWLVYGEALSKKAEAERHQWKEKAEKEKSAWEQQRKETAEKDKADRERLEAEEKEVQEKRLEEEHRNLVAVKERDTKEDAEKKAADEVIRQNQWLIDQADQELIDAAARERIEQESFLHADLESAATDRAACRGQIYLLEDKIEQLVAQNIELSGQLMAKDQDLSRVVLGIEAELNSKWEKLLQDTNQMHLLDKAKEGEAWEAQLSEILMAHDLTSERLGSSHQQFSTVQKEIIDLSAQVESQKAAFLTEKDVLVKSFKKERDSMHIAHKQNMTKLQAKADSKAKEAKYMRQTINEIQISLEGIQDGHEQVIKDLEDEIGVLGKDLQQARNGADTLLLDKEQQRKQFETQLNVLRYQLEATKKAMTDRGDEADDMSDISGGALDLSEELDPDSEAFQSLALSIKAGEASGMYLPNLGSEQDSAAQAREESGTGRSSRKSSPSPSSRSNPKIKSALAVGNGNGNGSSRKKVSIKVVNGVEQELPLPFWDVPNILHFFQLCGITDDKTLFSVQRSAVRGTDMDKFDEKDFARATGLVSATQIKDLLAQWRTLRSRGLRPIDIVDLDHIVLLTSNKMQAANSNGFKIRESEEHVKRLQQEVSDLSKQRDNLVTAYSLLQEENDKSADDVLDMVTQLEDTEQKNAILEEQALALQDMVESTDRSKEEDLEDLMKASADQVAQVRKEYEQRYSEQAKVVSDLQGAVLAYDIRTLEAELKAKEAHSQAAAAVIIANDAALKARPAVAPHWTRITPTLDNNVSTVSATADLSQPNNGGSKGDNESNADPVNNPYSSNPGGRSPTINSILERGDAFEAARPGTPNSVLASSVVAYARETRANLTSGNKLQALKNEKMVAKSVVREWTDTFKREHGRAPTEADKIEITHLFRNYQNASSALEEAQAAHAVVEQRSSTNFVYEPSPVIITDGGGNSANHSRMASVANSRSNSFEMNTTEQQSKSMAGVNSNRNKGGTGMVFTPATGNAAYDNTLTALSADVRALSEELEEADVQIVALREENSKLGEAAADVHTPDATKESFNTLKSGILLLKKRQIELIESNDKQHRQDSARMAEEIRVQHEQLQQQDSIREAFDQKLKEMEVEFSRQNDETEVQLGEKLLAKEADLQSQLSLKEQQYNVLMEELRADHNDLMGDREAEHKIRIVEEIRVHDQQLLELTERHDVIMAQKEHAHTQRKLLHELAQKQEQVLARREVENHHVQLIDDREIMHSTAMTQLQEEYDRVNREKAELHLQLLEGVDSSMRAIILEQEQEHVQKTRRSEDQQRLTLEALQMEQQREEQRREQSFQQQMQVYTDKFEERQMIREEEMVQLHGEKEKVYLEIMNKQTEVELQRAKSLLGDIKGEYSKKALANKLEYQELLSKESDSMSKNLCLLYEKLYATELAQRMVEVVGEFKDSVAGLVEEARPSGKRLRDLDVILSKADPQTAERKLRSEIGFVSSRKELEERIAAGVMIQIAHSTKRAKELQAEMAPLWTEVEKLRIRTVSLMEERDMWKKKAEHGGAQTLTLENLENPKNPKNTEEVEESKGSNSHSLLPSSTSAFVSKSTGTGTGTGTDTDTPSHVSPLVKKKAARPSPFQFGKGGGLSLTGFAVATSFTMSTQTVPWNGTCSMSTQTEPEDVPGEADTVEGKPKTEKESLQLLRMRQQLIMDRSDSQKKLSMLHQALLEKEKEEAIRASGLEGQVTKLRKEMTIVRTDSEQKLRAARTLSDSEKDDLTAKLTIVQKQSGSQLTRLQQELHMTRTDSDVQIKRSEDSKIGLEKRIQELEGLTERYEKELSSQKMAKHNMVTIGTQAAPPPAKMHPATSQTTSSGPIPTMEHGKKKLQQQDNLHLNNMATLEKKLARLESSQMRSNEFEEEYNAQKMENKAQKMEMLQLEKQVKGLDKLNKEYQEYQTSKQQEEQLLFEEVKDSHSAATKMQALHRGKKARLHSAEKRKTKEQHHEYAASAKVQALYRGKKARQDDLRRRNDRESHAAAATLNAQAVEEVRLIRQKGREEFENHKWSGEEEALVAVGAVRVQTLFRGYHSRNVHRHSHSHTPDDHHHAPPADDGEETHIVPLLPSANTMSRSTHRKHSKHSPKHKKHKHGSTNSRSMHRSHASDSSDTDNTHSLHSRHGKKSHGTHWYTKEGKGNKGDMGTGNGYSSDSDFESPSLKEKEKHVPLYKEIISRGCQTHFHSSSHVSSSSSVVASGSGVGVGGRDVQQLELDVRSLKKRLHVEEDLHEKTKTELALIRGQFKGNATEGEEGDNENESGTYAQDFEQDSTSVVLNDGTAGYPYPSAPPNGQSHSQSPSHSQTPNQTQTQSPSRAKSNEGKQRPESGSPQRPSRPSEGSQELGTTKRRNSWHSMSSQVLQQDQDMIGQEQPVGGGGQDQDQEYDYSQTHTQTVNNGNTPIEYLGESLEGAVVSIDAEFESQGRSKYIEGRPMSAARGLTQGQQRGNEFDMRANNDEDDKFAYGPKDSIVSQASAEELYAYDYGATSGNTNGGGGNISPYPDNTSPYPDNTTSHIQVLDVQGQGVQVLDLSVQDNIHSYQPQTWSIENADAMEFDNRQTFGSEVLGAVVGMPESVMDTQMASMTQGQALPVGQMQAQAQEGGYATGQGSYYNILEADLVQTRLRLARTAEALAQVTTQRDMLLSKLVEYRDVVRSLADAQHADLKAKGDQAKKAKGKYTPFGPVWHNANQRGGDLSSRGAGTASQDRTVDIQDRSDRSITENSRQDRDRQDRQDKQDKQDREGGSKGRSPESMRSGRSGPQSQTRSPSPTHTASSSNGNGRNGVDRDTAEEMKMKQQTQTDVRGRYQRANRIYSNKYPERPATTGMGARGGADRDRDRRNTNSNANSSPERDRGRAAGSGYPAGGGPSSSSARGRTSAADNARGSVSGSGSNSRGLVAGPRERSRAAAASTASASSGDRSSRRSRSRSEGRSPEPPRVRGRDYYRGDRGGDGQGQQIQNEVIYDNDNYDDNYDGYNYDTGDDALTGPDVGQVGQGAYALHMAVQNSHQHNSVANANNYRDRGVRSGNSGADGNSTGNYNHKTNANTSNTNSRNANASSANNKNNIPVRPEAPPPSSLHQFVRREEAKSYPTPGGATGGQQGQQNQLNQQSQQRQVGSNSSLGGAGASLGAIIEGRDSIVEEWEGEVEGEGDLYDLSQEGIPATSNPSSRPQSGGTGGGSFGLYQDQQDFFDNDNDDDDNNEDGDQGRDKSVMWGKVVPKTKTKGEKGGSGSVGVGEEKGGKDAEGEGEEEGVGEVRRIKKSFVWEGMNEGVVDPRAYPVMHVPTLEEQVTAYKSKKSASATAAATVATPMKGNQSKENKESKDQSQNAPTAVNAGNTPYARPGRQLKLQSPTISENDNINGNASDNNAEANVYVEVYENEQIGGNNGKNGNGNGNNHENVLINSSLVGTGTMLQVGFGESLGGYSRTSNANNNIIPLTAFHQGPNTRGSRNSSPQQQQQQPSILAAFENFETVEEMLMAIEHQTQTQTGPQSHTQRNQQNQQNQQAEYRQQRERVVSTALPEPSSSSSRGRPYNPSAIRPSAGGAYAIETEISSPRTFDTDYDRGAKYERENGYAQPPTMLRPTGLQPGVLVMLPNSRASKRDRTNTNSGRSDVDPRRIRPHSRPDKSEAHALSLSNNARKMKSTTLKIPSDTSRGNISRKEPSKGQLFLGGGKADGIPRKAISDKEFAVR